MNAEKASYRPIKFLDRLEGNNHIVLLSDGRKYADLIIARYFLNGLKNGGSCIFFTADEPETVEERLLAGGIDVDWYEQTNSLRIYSIERSDSKKHDVLSTLRSLREESTRGMRPPYRFVGRTITDIESREGMKLGLTLEKTGHEHFEEFDNSPMCYYDITRLERSMREEWIRELAKSHHYLIYASEPDRAVAFETTLLEDG
ncbi:MAG: MEDS domain-containing protein [Thaumarchaeota archaeon]|nr:MEDS domain-containing protein [Nitrososphaerota archaeon]